VTAAAQWALRTASVLVGILMAAESGLAAHGAAVVAAVLAVAVVVASTFVRPAATLAVLLVIAAMVLSDPPPWLAASCGLTAVAYLALRHAVGASRVMTITEPTVLGAVGFTFVGLAATAFPLQIPWLPLLAPLTIFGIYTLATRPFFGRGRRPPTVQDRA
jgi:hypothetical protein